MSIEYRPSTITKYRAGTLEDPYIPITESRKIINGQILLSEVPVRSNRVIIANHTEVQEIPAGGLQGSLFCVDYNEGIVSFSPSQEGNTISVSYKGRGVHYVAADRVWTKQDHGNVVETLGELIDSSQEALHALDELTDKLSEADQAIQELNGLSEIAGVAESNRAAAELIRNTAENIRSSAETSRQTAEVARSTAETTRASEENNRISAESGRKNSETSRQSNETTRQTAEASRQTEETQRTMSETGRSISESARVVAEDTRVLAESGRMSAESLRQSQEEVRKVDTSAAIAGANAAKEDASNAATVAHTAAGNADSKASYAQTQGDYAKAAGDNLFHKGDFSLGSAYKARNLVYYQGATYMCILDSTGNQPGNTTYFKKITNQRWLGMYNASTTYSFGDVVVDANSQNVYQCVKDSTVNAALNNASNWALLISIDSLVSRTNTAIETVNSAATQALTATTEANTARDGAIAAAGHANEQASLAETAAIQATGNASYAQTQGDYAKAQGNYAKSVGDSVVYKGSYNSTTAYVRNNSVEYNGSSYTCIASSTGNLPTNTDYWVMSARKGADGTGSMIEVKSTSGDLLVSNPTTSADISLNPAIKSKIEGISSNAKNVASSSTNGNIKIDNSEVNVYSHPAGDGNLHVPATGTTNNGKYLKAGLTAGSVSWSAIPPGDILLDNANRFVTDAEKTSWNAKASTSSATSSSSGLMSAADKAKLDGVATAANNYVHPTGDGNRHVPATGTSNSGKVLKAGANAASEAWGTVDWSELASKPQLTQRIVLSGQLQKVSYRKSVIALCDLTNTDISLNSYSAGKLYFKRGNGLFGMQELDFVMSKKYSSTVPFYQAIALGELVEGNIRPCTFTYNGVKYGGVEFFFSAAELSTVEFHGMTSLAMFGLDYWDTQNNVTLIQEVSDSLNYTDPVVSTILTYNGYDVYHSGNLVSEAIPFTDPFGNLSSENVRNAIGETYSTLDARMGAVANNAMAYTNSKIMVKYVRLASFSNITSFSGLPILDGMQVAEGDRILVKDQTTAANNGIYVASSGAWTRAADAQYDEDFPVGLVVHVLQGTTSSGLWRMTNTSPVTVGTTAISFVYAIPTATNISAGLIGVTDKNKLDGLDTQSMLTGPIKKAVRVATTANISLSGLQTIDGITLVANDRVLVKSQTNAAQNGIYKASSASWTRDYDADVSLELTFPYIVPVEKGTQNGGTVWMYSSGLAFGASPTVGTTAANFTRIIPNASAIPITDAGNVITATNVEDALQELFTSVSNGKALLETTITGLGGTVSKAGSVATFAELQAGINSIPAGQTYL
ncbi:hypothetical protein [Cohnella sp. GbtcB17]|uniref:hypothetical protein n=1 Tax=Cohnella sp. GbtcB17 TaxID=2824762 RepID=UPI001C307C11|nr:hypothetical protein [Cohnella sp. GbtcB17]